MHIVEVQSKKSHDLRRLLRATAMLLSGAAVHLWLFPASSAPGHPGLLDKVAAGMAAVARDGAVGTSRRGERGVVTSGLGTVAPATNAAKAGRAASGYSATRVRVTIETIHPTVVPPAIRAEPMQMADAMFTVPAAEGIAPDLSASDLDAEPEPMARPARLELPALTAAALSPEFDLARRALQPRLEPIAAVQQPPAHAMQATRHELPRRIDRPSDERLVSSVLQQYRQAYETLDVSAAQSVWPTVDARALGAAFRQLSAQRVTFDSCGVSVSGSGSQATARCTGQAEYMPKVGGRRTYTASGEWVFDLQKENADWRIINANANIK